MKFMKRAGIYKSSNVTFNPDKVQAYSYDWWRFVDVVNNKVVFNNYGYSNSTRKHQSKVRALLRDLGIEIDLVVESQSGLQNDNWKGQALSNLQDKIDEVSKALNNPRRKKSLDEERLTALNSLVKEKMELETFINSIQE